MVPLTRKVEVLVADSRNNHWQQNEQGEWTKAYTGYPIRNWSRCFTKTAINGKRRLSLWYFSFKQVMQSRYLWCRAPFVAQVQQNFFNTCSTGRRKKVCTKCYSSVRGARKGVLMYICRLRVFWGTNAFLLIQQIEISQHLWFWLQVHIILLFLPYITCRVLPRSKQFVHGLK